MSNKSTMLLEHHLKELKLPTFLREYDKLATQCATEGADHPDYLLRLSELELIDRHHRMVDRRIKAARFPTTKSLDTFDFLSMPSLNKALVLELARCEYIERCRNVIVVGNSGTGKTHIALGLGLAACQRGLSVGVRRQNKWDKRGAFKACNLDANRLRQFSDLPTSVRLDSFASPPVSSPVWRLGVRGTYPPA